MTLPFTLCSSATLWTGLRHTQSTVPPGTLSIRFLCLVYFFLVFITAPSSFASWTFLFGNYFSSYPFSSPPACILHGSKHCRYSHCPPSRFGRMPGSEVASCPPKSVLLPTIIGFKLHISRCQLDHITSSFSGWEGRCPIVTCGVREEVMCIISASFSRKTSPSPRLVLTFLRAGAWLCL